MIPIHRVKSPYGLDDSGGCVQVEHSKCATREERSGAARALLYGHKSATTSANLRVSSELLNAALTAVVPERAPLMTQALKPTSLVLQHQRSRKGTRVSG